MDSLVSVIIPAHNMEKWIKKCLLSVVNQTYRKIEIIVVDDESTDGTCRIVERLRKKYKNIKLYRKNRRGVSLARNFGLSVAQGAFVIFLDSDDWICKDAVEHLVEKTLLHNVDLVQGAVKVLSPSRSYINMPNAKCGKYSLNGKEDTINCVNSLGWDLHGSLFKKSIIDKNDLRFNSEYKLAEDTDFLLSYLNKASDIYISNKITYIYNQLTFTSSARKYYEDSNMWLYGCYQKFKSLFEKIQSDNTVVMICRNRAFNWFELALRNYIWNSSVEEYSAVISKIQITSDLFKKEFLLESSLPICNDKYQLYSDWVMHEEYEKLYWNIRQNDTGNAKKILKKVIVAIKQQICARC